MPNAYRNKCYSQPICFLYITGSWPAGTFAHGSSAYPRSWLYLATCSSDKISVVLSCWNKLSQSVLLIALGVSRAGHDASKETRLRALMAFEAERLCEDRLVKVLGCKSTINIFNFVTEQQHKHVAGLMSYVLSN